MMIGNTLTLDTNLGGAKVLVPLVDKRGDILASERHPADTGKSPSGVISDIVCSVRGCTAKPTYHRRRLAVSNTTSPPSEQRGGSVGDYR